MKKRNKKHVMVLFSGGLDSTYLIWKNLKKGNIVKPVYIEIKNNKNKSIVEIQQAKLLVEEFKKEFSDQIEEFKIVSEFRVNSFRSIVTFSQPLIWVLSVLFGIEKHYDEINIGYVIGDCAISFLREIRNLYKSTLPFTDEKKLPKLKFPIMKESKYSMLYELPENYVKLITSCEAPVLLKYGIKLNNNERYRFFEPCGMCEVCKKIKNNNYYNNDSIKLKYGININDSTFKWILNDNYKKDIK